jgi:hypothetical protein
VPQRSVHVAGAGQMVGYIEAADEGSAWSPVMLRERRVSGVDDQALVTDLSQTVRRRATHPGPWERSICSAGAGDARAGHLGKQAATQRPTATRGAHPARAVVPGLQPPCQRRRSHRLRRLDRQHDRRPPALRGPSGGALPSTPRRTSATRAADRGARPVLQDRPDRADREGQNRIRPVDLASTRRADAVPARSGRQVVVVVAPQLS